MKKMNLEDIQELIKFVAKSGATEVDLEFEGVKISIKSPPKKRRGEKEEPVTIIQQAPSQAVVAPTSAIPSEEKPPPITKESSEQITNICSTKEQICYFVNNEQIFIQGSEQIFVFVRTKTNICSNKITNCYLVNKITNICSFC